MPRGTLHLKKFLPRMTWHPKNLFNLYIRSGDEFKTQHEFKNTDQTLFQMRWLSKKLVRAYHGEYIPEKIFKRWFLPETIPDVRPRRPVLKGDDKESLADFARRRTKVALMEEEISRRGLPPVGSLMFGEVERRVDVFLFRCCFVHSVYEARRLILQGDVKLNGKEMRVCGTRLAPGDMVSVNPKAIRFVMPPEKFNYVPVEYPNSGLFTRFALPPYAAPWLFIPSYIEPSFLTCSAVYVRHPTARAGYSEIPTPYEADGPIMRFAWEWYTERRGRIRSKKQMSRMPEDRTVSRELIERGRKALGKDIERMRRISAIAHNLK